MRILFVENHAVFAANVARLFLARHTVTVVPGLAAAHEAMAAGVFDLVLVDYDLDDGKGDTFIRDVREQGGRVSIIGVSAREEGNAALRRAGASAVCSKMQFDRIQEVIEGVVRDPGTTLNEG